MKKKSRIKYDGRGRGIIAREVTEISQRSDNWAKSMEKRVGHMKNWGKIIKEETKRP